MRWQSVAATPLFARPPASESGVALRFPPQSKNCVCGESRVRLICVHPWSRFCFFDLGKFRAPFFDPLLDFLFHTLLGRFVIMLVRTEIILRDEMSGKMCIRDRSGVWVLGFIIGRSMSESGR